MIGHRPSPPGDLLPMEHTYSAFARRTMFKALEDLKGLEPECTPAERLALRPVIQSLTVSLVKFLEAEEPSPSTGSPDQ